LLICSAKNAGPIEFLRRAKKTIEEWKGMAVDDIEYRRWKEVHYFYESPLGIFWIRPDAGMVGSYELGIGKLLLGNYRHPYDAAESVGRRQSGYSLWDTDQNGNAPLDLRGWQFEIPESPKPSAQ
jgi:hypothetical protein